jgi:hypothetical protein
MYIVTYSELASSVSILICRYISTIKELYKLLNAQFITTVPITEVYKLPSCNLFYMANSFKVYTVIFIRIE